MWEVSLHTGMEGYERGHSHLDPFCLGVESQRLVLGKMCVLAHELVFAGFDHCIYQSLICQRDVSHPLLFQVLRG